MAELSCIPLKKSRASTEVGPNIAKRVATFVEWLLKRDDVLLVALLVIPQYGAGNEGDQGQE